MHCSTPDMYIAGASTGCAESTGTMVIVSNRLKPYYSNFESLLDVQLGNSDYIRLLIEKYIFI